MLLRFAQDDHDTRKQALATLPLWWDRMPQTVRNNIDLKVDCWKREHPFVSDIQTVCSGLPLILRTP